MSMSIWTEVGQKVVFSNPTSGYNKDQVQGQRYLRLGETYTIADITVHNYSTDVVLEEVPGQIFNSVLFDNETPVEEPNRDKMNERTVFYK